MKSPSATVSWVSEAGGNPRRCTFSDRCTIGRDLANRIILPEPSVSRRQAVMELNHIGLVLTNLSASTSLEIGHDERLEPGKRRVIPKGTTLVLGGVTIVVEEVHTTKRLLRCAKPSCARSVDPELTDCPWCGTSLAFANTTPSTGS